MPANEQRVKAAYEAWCKPRANRIELDHPRDAFAAGYEAALTDAAPRMGEAVREVVIGNMHNYGEDYFRALRAGGVTFLVHPEHQDAARSILGGRIATPADDAGKDAATPAAVSVDLREAVTVPLRLLAEEMQVAAIRGDVLYLRAMCIEGYKRIGEILKSRALQPAIGGSDQEKG